MFTCSVSASLKFTDFQHLNQIFDVIIEKRDYDIKNSIVMQRARGLC